MSFRRFLEDVRTCHAYDAGAMAVSARARFRFPGPSVMLVAAVGASCLITLFCWHVGDEAARVFDGAWVSLLLYFMTRDLIRHCGDLHPVDRAERFRVPSVTALLTARAIRVVPIALLTGTAWACFAARHSPPSQWNALSTILGAAVLLAPVAVVSVIVYAQTQFLSLERLLSGCLAVLGLVVIGVSILTAVLLARFEMTPWAPLAAIPGAILAFVLWKGMLLSISGVSLLAVLRLLTWGLLSGICVIAAAGLIHTVTLGLEIPPSASNALWSALVAYTPPAVIAAIVLPFALALRAAGRPDEGAPPHPSTPGAMGNPEPPRGTGRQMPTLRHGSGLVVAAMRLQWARFRCFRLNDTALALWVAALAPLVGGVAFVVASVLPMALERDWWSLLVMMGVFAAATLQFLNRPLALVHGPPFETRGCTAAQIRRHNFLSGLLVPGVPALGGAIAFYWLGWYPETRGIPAFGLAFLVPSLVIRAGLEEIIEESMSFVGWALIAMVPLLSAMLLPRLFPAALMAIAVGVAFLTGLRCLGTPRGSGADGDVPPTPAAPASPPPPAPGRR